jgi:hypothetical protein
MSDDLTWPSARCPISGWTCRAVRPPPCLGLGLGAAVEVDPPLRSVRVLDSDVDAEAPVRALGTTRCHGSSSLTTEGLKIKAGDHTTR